MSRLRLRSVVMLLGLTFGILHPVSAFLQVPAPVVVLPTVETDPVPHGKDAADDPAIWVHPADPTQSIIIGIDKKGGLAVYNLAGRQLQYLAGGRINNVDLRYHFPLAAR